MFKMRLTSCKLQKMLLLLFDSGLIVNEIHKNMGKVKDRKKCPFYTWIIFPGIACFSYPFAFEVFFCMCVFLLFGGSVGGFVVYLWFSFVCF